MFYHGSTSTPPTPRSHRGVFFCMAVRDLILPTDVTLRVEHCLKHVDLETNREEVREVLPVAPPSLTSSRPEAKAPNGPHVWSNLCIFIVVFVSCDCWRYISVCVHPFTPPLHWLSNRFNNNLFMHIHTPKVQLQGLFKGSVSCSRTLRHPACRGQAETFARSSKISSNQW